MTLTLIAFAVLMAISFARVPIAFAMGLVGFAGFALLRGFEPALGQLQQVAFATGLNYELTVLPLFILMGNFVTSSRLSEELYAAANAFMGHRRGGLAMATIWACGGFSAVSGSSMATAATMAKVAMPSMRKFGYSDTLATGAIAAGGTLGILIPPSTIMVIYGIMTQTNIGLLMAAGILPGLVAILFYLAAIQWTVRRDPSAGPPAERATRAEKWRRLWQVWGVVALFLLVMCGIIFGVFTPTEAAGIGASGAFLFALFRRELTWRKLYDVLMESAVTTAMMFTVLMGAILFSDFINFTGFGEALVAFVESLGINRWGVIFAIVIIYIILGTAMEELSMILLTVPLFFPLVMGLGFDESLGFPGDLSPADKKMLVQVWFGILIVCVVEIGMISPPVGVNVFVLRSMLPDVTTNTIFRGVMPFFFMDILRIGVLAALPIISWSLPWAMPHIQVWISRVIKWLGMLF